ncbi:MAG: ROK family protein [Polyangiaceae bacterium]
MLIGVDFTGPTLLAGVVDGAAVVREASHEVLPNASPADTLDALVRLVTTLDARPSAVGIAIPGQVNAQGLCWRLPNAPAFEGVPIAEEIATRLDCAVAVENRATAAALAERLFGHGRTFPSFMLITLGTGVGGGLVIGHQLYPGANGFGAEIGHMCIDAAADAPTCACGRRGCLEVFAGARGILQKFTEHGGLGMRLSQVVASARRGEPAGLHTLDALGDVLGRAIAGLQNLLDLNAVVLSGPLSGVYELFEARLRARLRASAFAPLLAEVPIVVSGLGEQASVVGAAYLATL